MKRVVSSLISPLEGEMSGRTEGGDSCFNVSKKIMLSAEETQHV